MPLDRQHYKHFWEKGWVVVEGVYPHGEVEQVAELALTVSRREASAGNLTVDQSDDGSATSPRKVECPFLVEEGFRPFVLDRRLRSTIEALLGGPPLLFSDQIFMKPPRFGSKKPFHQDNFYFRLTPVDQMITAWIALDDVDEENGCLRYIDGSHREGLLPHEPVDGEPHNLVPPDNLIDLSRQSLAVVGKGGVVFHHGEALHTSYRNESDRWRRGYATHWVTNQVRKLDSESHLDTAYFNRSELAILLS